MQYHASIAILSLQKTINFCIFHLLINVQIVVVLYVPFNKAAHTAAARLDAPDGGACGGNVKHKYGEPMIKGIKCVECGMVFKWSELKSENKTGLKTCNCPQCKASITTVFPTKKLVLLFVVVAIPSALLFYSITHFSHQVTQGLSFLTMGISFICARLFFNGFISTVSTNKNQGGHNA